MSNLWDRLPDEQQRHYRAFLDYRNMGEGRSLNALFARYRVQIENESGTEPPCRTKNTLARWSSQFNWVERAEAWDMAAVERAEAARREHEQALIDQLERDREEARNVRRMIIKQLHNFYVRMLNDVDAGPGRRPNVGVQDFGRLVSTAAKLMEESRREFNDLPTERQEIATDWAHLFVMDDSDIDAANDW